MWRSSSAFRLAGSSSAAPGAAAHPQAAGRSAATGGPPAGSTPPRDSAAAPSSRFSSSRMLPENSWVSRAAYASRSRVGHVRAPRAPRSARGSAARAAECPRAARAAAAARSRPRAAGSRDPRETPRARSAPGRFACVAARTRTSIGMRRRPPTLSISRSCRTRSSFACSVQRHVADLVEKQGAAARDLEPARPRLDAGRDAPLDAEELRLEQRLRQGRAVDRDEGLLGAVARARGSSGPRAPCRCRSRP